MPSSDRKPKRDRPDQKTPAHESGRGRHAHRPIQPPQYFDPEEPWDENSAEALTRLYESGEGYLHRRPEDKRAQGAPAQASPASQGSSAELPGSYDRGWLEARLAEVADKLQTSLAKINPDKAVEQLTHRLDAIEERFKEVLDRVAQRSDLGGLKLIEAHVLELSAYVEQSRSRLDRIDALDSKVESIARKLEEGDQQRLNALEQMLQNYSAEWRKSDTRTATALQQLEGAVARVGDTLETLEAHKPVPDLSLSVLNAQHSSVLRGGTDPISQVYAEAARSLEPDATRDILDAANYAPGAENRTETEEASAPASQVEAQPERTPSAQNASPLRGIRDKLRQAGLLGPEDDQDDGPTEPPAPEEPRTSKPSLRIRRFGPNLLLGGGILVFGIIGYLMVDALTAGSGVHHARMAQQGRPTHMAATPQDEQGEALSAEQETRNRGRILPPVKAVRIEGISSAIAAAFRSREEVSPPETTAPVHADEPGAGSNESPGLAMLPMTIGPASLRQAALRGDAAAQIEVANRFGNGQGVERDLAQALQWYTRAAAQGVALAQYRLAAFYERGWGAPRDLERARIWYARAAEQGNVKAMHNLGVLTAADGRGDLVAAAGWFAKAAEFGLPDSQINLAILHQNGLGIPKDPVQAYKWLALAARTGDREALARINQAKAQLSPDELATAEAAASAWRARAPDAAANDVPGAVSREGSG